MMAVGSYNYSNQLNGEGMFMFVKRIKLLVTSLACCFCFIAVTNSLAKTKKKVYLPPPKETGTGKKTTGECFACSRYSYSGYFGAQPSTQQLICAQAKVDHLVRFGFVCNRVE